ncbi:uncharacterized protein SCHCODRAFT_02753380 [Schizophyllum commune H4-8]|nr:uncharacterized protein SCHCODRAFT_02753380 [Schizophyllum commune H4-8]KAI5886202.1 hypothetical protein SCHCODRAFT_02753380 [Schizophyllum commune H4-8]
MPSSAASRVAEAYELTYLIFKHVQCLAGNATLLSAALTNSSVGSVALDVLWETQQSLLPLFQVLYRRLEFEIEETDPPGIDHYEACGVTFELDDDQMIEHQVLTWNCDPRKISTEEFERFYNYARRIKVLDDTYPPRGQPTKEEEDHIHLSHKVVFKVFSAGDGVLLPSLHKLNIGPRIMALFYGQSFRLEQDADETSDDDGEDDIDRSDDDDGMDGADEEYDEEEDEEDEVVDNTTLEACYLSVYEKWYYKRLFARLCRIDKLRSLGLQIDNKLSMVRAIRGFTHLDELHLKFADYKQGNTTTDIVSWTADMDEQKNDTLAGRTLKDCDARDFSGLKTLHLSDAYDLDRVARALHNLSSHKLRLEALHVRSWRHSDGTKPTLDLYAAILDKCDKHALRKLTMVTKCWGNATLAPNELFRDLVAFPNITDMCLHVADRSTDVAGCVELFAQAWPRLESLVFLNKPYQDRAPIYTSVKHLACLADRCPRLSYVSLQAKLDALPPLGSTPKSRYLDRSVTLNIGEHSLEDLEGLSERHFDNLVEFLSSIFPYPTLKAVTYDVLQPITDDYPESALATFDDPFGEDRQTWIVPQAKRTDVVEANEPEADLGSEDAVKTKTKSKKRAPTSKKSTKTTATRPEAPATPRKQKQPVLQQPPTPKKPPVPRAPESHKKKLVADDSLEALNDNTVPTVIGTASASTAGTNKATAAEPTGKRKTKATIAATKAMDIDSAFQITSFHDAGGHRLRSKRSTPASTQEAPPAKRRRTAAAKPEASQPKGRSTKASKGRSRR